MPILVCLHLNFSVDSSWSSRVQRFPENEVDGISTGRIFPGRIYGRSLTRLKYAAFRDDLAS